MREMNKLADIRSYDIDTLKKDSLASLTLLVMIIPQGMAYALLAGVPPEMGLYAATIPMLVYALLGSSRHLSVGPVAITSLLVFTAVSAYAPANSGEYIQYVIVLAAMVGLIQLLLGIGKAGFIVKFIPHSVFSAYTSAVAIIIGLSQLNHLLGVNSEGNLRAHAILYDLGSQWNSINGYTVLLGTLSLLLILWLKNKWPRLPAPLLAIVLAIGAVIFLGLQDAGVAIVGQIPAGLPIFALPGVTGSMVINLLPMAVVIALMGFMESLSIGRAISKKEHYAVRPNQELKALGMSNLVGSFFQAFPVNGSFSRTAVNHEAGGQTKAASVLTAVGVLIVLLFFTSMFYYLPNAVLAAIIISAVYKLVDVHQAKHLFDVRPLEGWVWVLTFFATLVVGIQWGIIIGAVFTLLFIIRQSMQPNIAELGYLSEEGEFRDRRRFPEALTFRNGMLLRIDSNIHFANYSYVEEHVRELAEKRPDIYWMVIDMSGVNDMDTSSVEQLEEFLLQLQQETGMSFYLANVKGSVRDTIAKAEWRKDLRQRVSYQSVEHILEQMNVRLPSPGEKRRAKGPNDFMI